MIRVIVIELQHRLCLVITEPWWILRMLGWDPTSRYAIGVGPAWHWETTLTSDSIGAQITDRAILRALERAIAEAS